MQDRYAGDIGDYGKLGLLRKLSEKFSIGTNWYDPGELDFERDRNGNFKQEDGKYRDFSSVADYAPEIASALETLKDNHSIEMLEKLVLYYKANKPEDSDWVVLPVTNFDAYFGGSGFSRKYLSRIPKELVQREKQSYGVSRYRVDLTLLQDFQPENMPDFLLELLRSGNTPF